MEKLDPKVKGAFLEIVEPRAQEEKMESKAPGAFPVFPDLKARMERVEKKVKKAITEKMDQLALRDLPEGLGSQAQLENRVFPEPTEQKEKLVKRETQDLGALAENPEKTVK